MKSSKKTEAAVKKLMQKIADFDELDNSALIEEALRIGKPAINALINALGDKELDIKGSLVAFGYNLTSLLDEILRLHPEVDLREAIPALLKMMEEDEDRLLRASACGIILCMISGHPGSPPGSGRSGYPEYDWKGVVPTLIAGLADEYEDVRDESARCLRELAESHPEYDFSGSVLPLIEMLKEEINVDSAAMAIAIIRKAHPGYDFSEAFPLLIKALEEGGGDARGSAAKALLGFEPRGYSDLQLVRKVAEFVKREHPEYMNPVCMRERSWKRCLKYLARLYPDWSAKLNRKAAGVLDEKKFHVPKVEKPDKTERVLRVRRMGSHG